MYFFFLHCILFIVLPQLADLSKGVKRATDTHAAFRYLRGFKFLGFLLERQFLCPGEALALGRALAGGHSLRGAASPARAPLAQIAHAHALLIVGFDV